ncbi:MAG: long-chain fatty acid--CoA ligase [Candidatus Rokubacteria bacterium]|nr:long-chain fatty acid--CoA ligase [Candidatus Rokubacteria bacterium]
MNVGRLLARTAHRVPERPAVVWGDTVVTYRGLNERVNRLVNALHGLGLRTGDRVATVSQNRPELLEVMFACFRAGFVLVPMNTRLHPDEHAYILRHSEAAALVYGDAFHDIWAATHGTVGSLTHGLTLGGPDSSYERAVASAKSSDPSEDLPDDAPAWLFYTSGTTGRPKGATLTQRNLLALVRNLLTDINPVEPDDVLLHVGPLSHASGLCAPHHIVRGATHVILKHVAFDPRLVLDAIARHRVTTMFMVPTMIVALLDALGASRDDRSSLRTIIYGGAPMSVARLREGLERLGSVFVQLYGQGEAPHTLTVLPKHEHTDGAASGVRSRLASAGRECTAVEVRIVDNDDRAVPCGTVGEIVARGDIVMRGYWNDAPASAETLRGGWLHTGDLGYLDEQGYLFLTDRKKDVIISGGMNVYSREVEDAICLHPDVGEAAVIGVPDPYWGESIKAFVVLRAGASVSEAAIVDACRAHLASYKKPRFVEFVRELPKGATGKILKRALKGQAGDR